MAQRWSSIFRKLGYAGIRDTMGLIDQRQPEQAVFFSKSAFEVVELVINTDTKFNIASQQLG